MIVSRILTALLLIFSIGLFAFLYTSIQDVIDSRARIETQEDEMVERLRLIREAEIVFQEQMGHYTANWFSLTDFIKNGQVPIIQRTEKIEQQAYGGEKVTLIIDTLGFIPARERIFKKNFTMNASENGTFKQFNIKVGDRVFKNQKAYLLNNGQRDIEPVFIEEGQVASLASLSNGDKVTKGQILIQFWNYQFNPNVDLNKLGEIPYMPGKMIDIFVGKVDKGGLMVDVIEVWDPHPVDPERNERNEAKTRKPLRFGSRMDVSTAGNWE